MTGVDARNGGKPDASLNNGGPQDVLVQLDPQYYRLQGELSFATAPAVLRDVLPTLRKARGLVVLDLAEIRRADSAGVALLIEFLRVAKQRHIDLRFAHLSRQVTALATVSGVDALLPRAP